MAELPDDVITEVKRLTRLARGATDPGEREAYRSDRAETLAEYDFVSRVREDDVLVLHPEEWVVDGAVDPARIDDIDRGVEVTLEGGDEGASWDDVEDHNDALVAAVAAEHGEVHAQNARAFADFMGNHYLQRVETATSRQLREFVDEYFPRNAWPSDEQTVSLAESIELLFDAADADLPEYEA